MSSFLLLLLLLLMVVVLVGRQAATCAVEIRNGHGGSRGLLLLLLLLPQKLAEVEGLPGEVEILEVSGNGHAWASFASIFSFQAGTGVGGG